MYINPYIIIPALGIICNAALAGYVLLKDPKSHLRRVYFAFTLCFILWNVGEFLLNSVWTSEAAILANDLEMVGIIYLTPTFLHFAFIFAGKKDLLSRKITYLWLYLPGLVFVCLDWFTDLIIVRQPDRLYHGYYVFPTGSGFWAFLAHTSAYFIAGCIVSWKIYKASMDWRKKKQAKYFLTAFLVTGIFGIIVDGVLQMFKVVAIAQTTLLCSIFSTGLIAYAMVRYGFLSITSQLAAETIVRAMPDFLVVLDGSLDISFANSRVYDVLGYREKDLKGRPIEAIFFDGKDMGKLKESVLRSPVSDHEIDCLAADGTKIPVSLSSFPLEEAGGRVLGVVTVARDMRQTQEFIRQLEESKAEIEKRGGELEKSRESLEDKNRELEGLNGELKGKYGEIERFNKLMMGREVKMMELKKENAELKARLGDSWQT